MSNPVEILLAEDEEHIAKLVLFKLTREGFRVSVAKNGREAIDMIEEGPDKHWGVVILDVMMPICDGWEVLKFLRSSIRPGYAGIPVLMLTAKNYDRDVTNAAELGATQFLKKPFDPAELARVVRAMTGMGEAVTSS